MNWLCLNLSSASSTFLKLSKLLKLNVLIMSLSKKGRVLLPHSWRYDLQILPANLPPVPIRSSGSRCAGSVRNRNGCGSRKVRSLPLRSGSRFCKRHISTCRCHRQRHVPGGAAGTWSVSWRLWTCQPLPTRPPSQPQTRRKAAPTSCVISKSASP